jgi:peptidoglycan hydrolase-like protein with peptidoglycan-binding domain
MRRSGLDDDERRLMRTPMSTSQRAHGWRRPRTFVIAGIVVVLLVGGAGFAAVSAFGETEAPTVKRPIGAGEATIEQGTLSGSVKGSGSLSYSGARDIGSGIGGVVTWVPSGGAQVGLGQPLFAVNNVQVYLFHGALPAWRDFASGMDDGPDVKQLEESLKTLGYFSGTPDNEFTYATKAAIQAWQKATGHEQTGSISLGAIVFQSGDVRVSGVKAKVGDQVGGGSPVVSVTSLTKQVLVSLRLSDQQVAKVGGKVTIELPGGKSTPGTIQSVGVPTQQDPTNANSAVVIPTVITLDDPRAAGDFQQATVVVDFPSDTRKNVLSVPVEALIALPGNTFGVEIVKPDGTTKRVPVKTGLFAGGRVQISGDGISKGQKVVVPKI